MAIFGHNSTIAKKQKPCKSCGKPSYIFSRGRCADCSRIEDTQKRMAKETDKMIVEEDLTGLIEDADRVFSQYIRLKYADERGLVTCYTCPTNKHWSLIQNGHYIKRANLYLRWDERNCRPQCVECNEIKHGNMVEYTKRLEVACKGITDLLRAESYLVHKPTREEIRAIIAEYTPLVAKLKKQLNHGK